MEKPKKLGSWGLQLGPRCAAVGLFVLLFGACSTRGYEGNLWEIRKESNYFSTTRAHTKETKHYIDLNRGYIMYLTLKTPQFRTAYVNEYAEKYKLPVDQQSAMMAEEQAEAGKGIDLVVAVNGYEGSWEKLEEAAGTWKIRCQVNDGDWQPPVSLSTLTKDPKLGYFFPYVNHWTKVYLVRCPFPADLKQWSEIHHLVARFAGVLGTSEFRWQLPVP